jgi:hypothetical protein
MEIFNFFVQSRKMEICVNKIMASFDDYEPNLSYVDKSGWNYLYGADISLNCGTQVRVYNAGENRVRISVYEDETRVQFFGCCIGDVDSVLEQVKTNLGVPFVLK